MLKFIVQVVRTEWVGSVYAGRWYQVTYLYSRKKHETYVEAKAEMLAAKQALGKPLDSYSVRHSCNVLVEEE